MLSIFDYQDVSQTYSHGIFLTRSDVQNIVSTIIVDTWAALRELTKFSRDAHCG